MSRMKSDVSTSTDIGKLINCSLERLPMSVDEATHPVSCWVATTNGESATVSSLDGSPAGVAELCARNATRGKTMSTATPAEKQREGFIMVQVGAGPAKTGA